MFKNIKEKITEYLSLKFEIIRLEVIERLVNVMGYTIFTMLVIFLAFSCIFFTGFGLAEWIGELLNKRYAGYFIMGGMLLLALVIAIWQSGFIIKFFANKFVTMLTSSTANDESDEVEEKSIKDSNK